MDKIKRERERRYRKKCFVCGEESTGYKCSKCVKLKTAPKVGKWSRDLKKRQENTDKI